MHNVHRGTLHGVSWGSRRLYTWRVAGKRHSAQVASSDWVPNPQFYIDYQDCHYQGSRVHAVRRRRRLRDARWQHRVRRPGSASICAARVLEHQVPVNLFIDEGSGAEPGLALTHNAFWVEPLGTARMRALLHDRKRQPGRSAGVRRDALDQSVRLRPTGRRNRIETGWKSELPSHRSRHLAQSA